MEQRIADVSAHDRARARDPRPDQHSVRHPRREAVHYRGEPARQPHGADHPEGDRHQPRRRGDAYRAGREACAIWSMASDCCAHVPYVVVKVPVFSFSKMRGVETVLGPEMKSTGEVLGIDESFGGALRKGFLAAGVRLPGTGGRILVSIADEEKEEAIPVLRRVRCARAYARRDARHARGARGGGHRDRGINKIARRIAARPRSHRDRARVDLVINDAKGAREISDDYKIRRAAVEASIACLTSLDTARALAEALASKAGPPRSLQEYRARHGDDRLVESSPNGARRRARRKRHTLAVANSFTATGPGGIDYGTPDSARVDAARRRGRRHVGRTSAIPLAGLFDWIDRTFPPEDEHAFVAPMRDLDLLARIGWNAPLPESSTTQNVVNLDDLPEEVADGLAQPPCTLVQCAACRRLCVRDEFVWKEKQLCAWDYHAQVFGKRGPWHDGIYEDRHFETLPACAYVAPPLLLDARRRSRAHGRRRRAKTTARAMVNALLEARSAAARTWPCARRARATPSCARHDQPRNPTPLGVFSCSSSSSWRCAKSTFSSIAAPHIAANARTIRATRCSKPERGRILATDGTVLAQTVGGTTRLSAGRRARAVGRLRFGALRNERDRRRLRSRADAAGLQRRSRSRSSPQLAATLRGTPDRRARRGRRHDDRAGGPSAALHVTLALSARRGRRARSAHRRRARASQRAELRSQRLRCRVSVAEHRLRTPAARSRARRALSAGLDLQDLHRRGGARQQHRHDGFALRRSRVSCHRRLYAARQRERGDGICRP